MPDKTIPEQVSRAHDRRFLAELFPADDVPVLGLEDTDIMRHREITSKAVSAILILTLKWFKTSRSSTVLAFDRV